MSWRGIRAGNERRRGASRRTRLVPLSAPELHPSGVGAQLDAVSALPSRLGLKLIWGERLIAGRRLSAYR